MTGEFLNFKDEITDFGKKFVASAEIFERFVQRKKLRDDVAFGFRILLQHWGIL